MGFALSLYSSLVAFSCGLGGSLIGAYFLEFLDRDIVYKIVNNFGVNLY